MWNETQEKSCPFSRGYHQRWACLADDHASNTSSGGASSVLSITRACPMGAADRSVAVVMRGSFLWSRLGLACSGRHTAPAALLGRIAGGLQFANVFVEAIELGVPERPIAFEPLGRFLQ